MLSFCSPSTIAVTPLHGNRTWECSTLAKKDELVETMKGQTWGPSSTLHKERLGGEESYLGTG